MPLPVVLGVFFYFFREVMLVHRMLSGSMPEGRKDTVIRGFRLFGRTACGGVILVSG
jgi:hypothetical protein